MTDRSGELRSDCPNKSCKNAVVIELNWTAGGINDYGGYILECQSCGTLFDLYVGRDIDFSRVVSGAKKLASYDRETPGERNIVRKEHGIPPAKD